jgi:hypothetical protein
MQNQLNNFNQTVEKKYLPNGEKDVAVGRDVIFNLLDKKVEIKVCESIFLKSLAILALNNDLTIERLREHLAASKTFDLFTEIKVANLHIFLKKIEEMAAQGKGASQIVEKIPQQVVNVASSVTADTSQVSARPQTIIALIIIAASLIATGFYWYQIRPSEIRKSCYAEVSNSPDVVSRDKFEFRYKICLNKYGITN